MYLPINSLTCVLLSPRRSLSPSFSLLWLSPLLPFLSLSSSSDSNKAGKLWGCINALLDMTLSQPFCPLCHLFCVSAHPSSPERTSAKADVSIYPSWLLMMPLLSFFSFFSFTTWALFLPPLFTVQWQLHPWLDRECAAAKPGAQFLYPECFPLLICVSYLFVWNNQLQHLVMRMSEVLFGCMIYHNCLLTSLFPQLCSVDVFLHALDLTWT